MLRHRLALLLALLSLGCGSSERPESVHPVVQERCFEMPPLSANQVVDSAAVADTLHDVLGAGYPDATFELAVLTDTMHTEVTARSSTLPDSVTRLVERLVDWNALPDDRPRPPVDTPELRMLAARDTAAQRPRYLKIELDEGQVASMTVERGRLCQPRLINGAELLYSLREGALRFTESGAVTARLFIDPSGEVFHTEIVQTSGFPGLDALARGLLMGARFEPASMYDRPIPIMTEIPFEFRVPRRRR